MLNSLVFANVMSYLSQTRTSRRSEEESLLDHPTSDKFFQQVNLPMTQKIKAKNEDDDEDRRIRAAQREKDPFLEIEVKSGDTLQSLALKFNVPLSELKRINNIFSQNEFFALKKIKVPVKPLSFLSEQLEPEINKNDTSSSDWKVEHFSSPPASSEISSPAALSDESGDNSRNNFASSNNNNKSLNRQVRKTRKLLKAVDKDIATVKQKNQIIKSTVIHTRLDGWDEAEFESDNDEGDHLMGFGQNSAESVLLLPSKHSINVTRPPDGSKILCVCCIALIVIAVIIILVFSEYEYEEIEHKNRTDIEHNQKP